MKKLIFLLFVINIVLLTPTISLYAQNEEKPKSTEQMAAEEAERLEALLKLEPHQVFYVDSILQHDMKCMKEEVEEMRKSGMREYTSYRTVQEKWLEQIRGSFEKIFTPEQWLKYQKDAGIYKKEKKKKGKK